MNEGMRPYLHSIPDPSSVPPDNTHTDCTPSFNASPSGNDNDNLSHSVSDIEMQDCASAGQDSDDDYTENSYDEPSSTRHQKSSLPQRSGPSRDLRGRRPSRYREDIGSTIPNRDIETSGDAHDVLVEGGCSGLQARQIKDKLHPVVLPTKMEGRRKHKERLDQNLPWTNKELSKLVHLYNENYSFGEIAERLNKDKSRRRVYNATTLARQYRNASKISQNDRKSEPQEMIPTFHLLAIEACEKLTSPTWENIVTYVKLKHPELVTRQTPRTLIKLKCFTHNGKKGEDSFFHNDDNCRRRRRFVSEHLIGIARTPSKRC
jgi:hypothetical protein